MLSINFSAVTATTTLFSGDFHFDYHIETAQKNSAGMALQSSALTPTMLTVPWVRLNVKHQVKNDYDIQVQLSHQPKNTQFFQAYAEQLVQHEALNDFCKITRAFINYNRASWLEASLGLIEAPDITITAQAPYQVGIANTVGRLIAMTGNYPGIRAQGTVSLLSYDIALWQQTTTARIKSFTPLNTGGLTSTSTFANITPALVDQMIIPGVNLDNNHNHFGYGWRFGFAPVVGINGGYCLGAGFNSAPLNVPIIIATLTNNGAAEFTAFNYLSNAAVDFSVVSGSAHLSGGFNYQHVAKDVSYGVNNPGIAANAFNKSAMDYSFWIEGAYLLSGGSYQIDSKKAQLKSASRGWELGLSYGMQTQRDLFALVDTIGQDDFLNESYQLNGVTIMTGANRLSIATGPDSADRSHDTVQDQYQLIGIDNTLVDNAYAYVIEAINNQGKPVSSFMLKTTSIVMNLNYRPNDATVFKLEFQHDHHAKTIFGYEINNDTPLPSVKQFMSIFANSVNYKTVLNLRARLAYTF